MLITDERLFCEEIRTDIPELANIGEIFKTKGLACAEKQLADYLRKTARVEEYFQLTYNQSPQKLWAGEDIFAAAERFMAGELTSCGRTYQFPNGVVDWEYNPTYNEYPEWTWQLSRHPEWICLAKCYRDTGDEKYTKGFLYFLMSWCEQAICPENISGYDTNCWRTIEAGLRMCKSWHYAFHAFIRSPEFHDHAITTFIKSIWEHGYRLRNFNTAANWLLLEMAGLSQLGIFYPVLKKAEEWKEYGLNRLTEELVNQIYPDSFQFELTTGYQGVLIASYMYVLETTRGMRVSRPKALQDNLERAYEMYVKLCQPDGRTPDINDGGRTDVKYYTAQGARYFPYRQDFQYFATDGAEGKLPDYKSIALPYAGMAVMRTGWSKDDMWFFMESAPFGKSHQHEDKLNVLMYAYGHEVLKDPGNYDYDSSQMRKFIRDTRSHNCAMVDDCSQNRRGKYVWHPEDIKKFSNLKWSFSEDVDVAEGCYDEGYGPEYIPAIHTRKAVFFKKGLHGSAPFAILFDRLTAAEAHKYALSFQMNVEPYSVSGNMFTQDYGDGVTMHLISADTPEVVIAQKEPYWMGWRPKFGATSEAHEHYHAPCVRYVADGQANYRYVTVLYPSNSGAPAIREVIASHDVKNTEATLVFANGEKVVVHEEDYPTQDAVQHGC